MLRIERVSVAYGKHVALHDVTLDVPAGRTTVILGANGAGKTTLLKTIAGLLRPAPGGRILFEGRAIERDPPHAMVEAGIALVPEGRRLFADMTVIDNLRMGAYTPHARADEARRLERQLALFPRLAERRDQLARTMSGGEQQMLAIARALMSEPKLLLLDEPSLGLSPRLVKDLFGILKAIARGGQSVVLVEQNVRQSLRLADHVYVLENGRIERSGSVAEIEKDAAIQKAYLGIAPERQPAQPKAPASERQSAGGFVNPFARSVAARSLNGHAEERSMPNQQDGPPGSGFFHPFARSVTPQSAKPSLRPVETPEPGNSAQPPAAPAERMPIPTSGGFVNPQARAPKQ
jgi:ABC-type branched-subunit amino acid transport system ATPase component